MTTTNELPKWYNAHVGAIEYAEFLNKSLADWVSANASKLSELGGWHIDFNSELTHPQLTDQIMLPETKLPVVILDNVIPAACCKEFNQKHEQIGFTTQYELDRKQRKPIYKEEDGFTNTSEVITINNDTFADLLWERVKDYIPNEYIFRGNGYFGGYYAKRGVIPTLRFLRYKPGQFFQYHYDPQRVVKTFKGQAGIFKSLFTIAMYLNDQSEFKGGELNFLKVLVCPKRFESLLKVPCAPGRVVLFPHDYLHEGGQLQEGTKYMVQCDVAFEWVGDNNNQ